MAINFTREGRIEPYSMPENKDSHSAWKSKGVGYKTKRVIQKQLTTDVYTDSLVFDMRLFSRVLIHVKEFNVNAIKYNVLACLNPTAWETLFADQVVLVGATSKQTISEAWNFIKVQVRSNVDATQGQVMVSINGKTP